MQREGLVGRQGVAEDEDLARGVDLEPLVVGDEPFGDLERVDRWLRIFGMVNAAPDFNEFPAVINGCSDLLVATRRSMRLARHNATSP